MSADTTQPLQRSSGRRFGPRQATVVSERHVKVDVPTLIALSTVAWALTDVLHEIVGHAGAAVLLGIPVRAVSTTTVYIVGDQIRSLGDVRMIDAGGTVLNLVTGGLALLALRSPRVTGAASRCFLWLFATMSFVVVTLNLLVGSDFTDATSSLNRRGLWHAGIVAVGLLVAVAGYALPLRLWMPDLRKKRRLQLKITAIPVAVVIVVQALSVVRSPFTAIPLSSGMNALITVAALAFFFGFWLVLVNLLRRPRSTKPAEAIQLPRSKSWLAVGLMVLVVFVAVLGPGLGPLKDDPRLNSVALAVPFGEPASFPNTGAGGRAASSDIPEHWPRRGLFGQRCMARTIFPT